MAEYRQGDRVVKMSGVCAGKYGTVNSVREDGTLNVTFDGERLSRFCDPERCGKVAANAAKPVGVYRGCKISVADHSPDDVTRPGKTYIVEDADGVSVGGFETSDAAKRWCDQHPSRCANSRAANAKDAFGAEVKVGDTVKFATGTFRGLIGEVVKIDGARAIVRTDEHGDVTEDLKVIRVYNSSARNANGWPNARMKFKAGDKVRHKTNGLDGVVEGWASDPGQYRVRASGRVYEWDEDDLVLARNAARNAVPIYAAHVGPMMGKPSAWAVVDPMAKEIKSFLSLYDAAKSGRNKRSAARAILLWGQLRDYVIFEMAGREATEKAGTTAKEMERKKNELWKMYGFKNHDDLIANR